jgi:hypothetical protein
MEGSNKIPQSRMKGERHRPTNLKQELPVAAMFANE